MWHGGRLPKTSSNYTVLLVAIMVEWHCLTDVTASQDGLLAHTLSNLSKYALETPGQISFSFVCTLPNLPILYFIAAALPSDSTNCHLSLRQHMPTTLAPEHLSNWKTNESINHWIVPAALETQSMSSSLIRAPCTAICIKTDNERLIDSRFSEFNQEKVYFYHRLKRLSLSQMQR